MRRRRRHVRKGGIGMYGASFGELLEELRETGEEDESELEDGQEIGGELDEGGVPVVGTSIDSSTSSSSSSPSSSVSMGEGWVWRAGGGHRSKRGVGGGEVSVGPHRPDRCLACCVKLLGQQRRNTRRSRDVSTGSCRNRTDTESSGEKYLVAGERESPVARRRKGTTLSMIPSGNVSVGNTVTRASDASSTSIDVGTFQRSEEIEDEGEGSNSKSVIRKEILKYIMRMSNPLWWKLSRQTLLSLKQKHPQSFQDVCLYSEVSACLGSASYRLISRHFIQELFFDLTFDELYEQSANILHLTESSDASAVSGTSSALPATPHSASSPSQVETGPAAAGSSEHQLQTHNSVNSPVRTISGSSNAPPVSHVQMSPSGVRTILGLPSLAEEETPCDNAGTTVGKLSMPKESSAPKTQPQSSLLSTSGRDKTVSETGRVAVSQGEGVIPSTKGGKCGSANGMKSSVLYNVGDKRKETVSSSSVIGSPISGRIVSELKGLGGNGDGSGRLAAKVVGSTSDDAASPRKADGDVNVKKEMSTCTSTELKVTSSSTSKNDVGGKMVFASIPKNSGERQGISTYSGFSGGREPTVAKNTGNTGGTISSAGDVVGDSSGKASSSNTSDESSCKVLSTISTVNDIRAVVSSIVSLSSDSKMPTPNSVDGVSGGKASLTPNTVSDVSTKILSRTSTAAGASGKIVSVSRVQFPSDKCNVASVSGVVSVPSQVPTSAVLSALTATCCSVVANQSTLVATKTSSLTKPTSSAITLPSSCIMPTLNVSVRSSPVSQPAQNEDKSNIAKRKSLEKKLVNR